MSFQPENYLEARQALDEISTEAKRLREVMDNGIANYLNRAATDLQGMGAAWKPALDYIDAQVLANPADTDWLRLKAEADKIKAAFLVMRDLAISVRDAAQAARNP